MGLVVTSKLEKFRWLLFSKYVVYYKITVCFCKFELYSMVLSELHVDAAIVFDDSR